MSTIRIIDEKCIGCGLCIKVCPFDAIKLVEKLAVIDLDKCTLCVACKEACKFEAIVISKQQKIVSDISAYKGVWVFAEQRNSVINSVAFELLGKACQLAADLNTYVGAVLLGHNVKDKALELIGRGADNVFVVDSAFLENYLAENYAKVIVTLIDKHRPEIFLAGATSCGRSLVSRIAVSVYAGLTADCTGLDIDKEKKILIQTRPAFGG